MTQQEIMTQTIGEISNDLPFRECTDYEIESEYTTPKQYIQSLMMEKGADMFVRRDHLHQMMEINEKYSPCAYYDEDAYKREHNKYQNTNLKLYSMNIRSLPKHKGELIAYLSNFNLFDIIVITEIGAKNIDLATNILENYTFYNVLPISNRYGGVGVYIRNTITNVIIREDLVSTSTCECPRCEIESLIIDFSHNNITYSLCAIYRHPNGNQSHYINYVIAR